MKKKKKQDTVRAIEQERAKEKHTHSKQHVIEWRARTKRRKVHLHEHDGLTRTFDQNENKYLKEKIKSRNN